MGIIAAAGIVALESMVERLADDHANARRLAAGLAQIPGITLDPDAIQTNIVIFEWTGGAGPGPHQPSGRARRQGLLHRRGKGPHGHPRGHRTCGRRRRA